MQLTTPSFVEHGVRSAVESAIRNRRLPMAKQPKQLDDLFHEGLKDIYFAERKS